MSGFLSLPESRDIARIDAAITEIRTILLVMMQTSPDVAERFRRSWFPELERDEQ